MLLNVDLLLEEVQELFAHVLAHGVLVLLKDLFVQTW